MDLTIEGKAYINGFFQDCCIGIVDGKISAIKKILKGDEHYNFGKKLILPAAIDMHVHFRDPGMTHKEDFTTGSMASAFGGISCVFDMPNTIPQTSTVHALSDKIFTADKKSYVDFGIYTSITNNNLDDIDNLSKKCSGFKIYLGSSTNALLFDKKDLQKALEKIDKTKKITLFHAEDNKLLMKYKSTEKDISDHLRVRPSKCEATSIKDILSASTNLNLRIHICHLSSIEGLELLKNRPSNISLGVTPHHSLLSFEKKVSPQVYYKVNPPLRTKFDKESLFDAIKNGFADVIESDHAPHTLDEKNVDFNDAPSGIPGVETMFPLFLHYAKKQIISIQRVISLLCEKPAELTNVNKGKIEVGRDADFTIVDLKDESKIKSENLHSKCGWSSFEGWPAIFPSYVFVRGEKLIEDKEIQVGQGFGKFVGV